MGVVVEKFILSLTVRLLCLLRIMASTMTPVFLNSEQSAYVNVRTERDDRKGDTIVLFLIVKFSNYMNTMEFRIIEKRVVALKLYTTCLQKTY